jgi:hypothetical protein
MLLFTMVSRKPLIGLGRMSNGSAWLVFRASALRYTIGPSPAKGYNPSLPRLGGGAAGRFAPITAGTSHGVTRVRREKPV